jgi:hypothetical protein
MEFFAVIGLIVVVILAVTGLVCLVGLVFSASEDR